MVSLFSLFTYIYNMIKIEYKNGVKYVNSTTLYKKLKMNPAHYSRWIVKNIQFAVENKDYIPIRISHKGGHKEYLFTIEFARGLCLVAKTTEAKKLSFFLIT